MNFLLDKQLFLLFIILYKQMLNSFIKKPQSPIFQTVIVVNFRKRYMFFIIEY